MLEMDKKKKEKKIKSVIIIFGALTEMSANQLHDIITHG